MMQRDRGSTAVLHTGDMGLYLWRDPELESIIVDTPNVENGLEIRNRDFLGQEVIESEEGRGEGGKEDKYCYQNTSNHSNGDMGAGRTRASRGSLSVTSRRTGMTWWS